MNIKRLEYVKEFLTEQMNHWMLFPLALTYMSFNRELAGMRKPDLLLWALCSVFPLVFFVFRCTVKRFSAFVLLHIAVAALTVIFSALGSIRGIICVFAVFGYAVHSIILQLKKGRLYCEPVQLPVAVLISAVTMVLQGQTYHGRNSWDSYYSLILIAAMGLFFIIFYLQRYLDFLAVNKSSTGYMPASEMLHSGLGLTLGYTLFGTAILVISTHFGWFSEIMNDVGNFLLWLLKLIFAKLPKGEPGTDRIIDEGVGELPTDVLPPNNEPFWLWNVLWQIVEMIFLIAIAFMAVKLLVRLLRWLQGLVFRRPVENIQEENAYDVREKCVIEKTPEKKKQKFFASLSYRERIRKLYKRKLLSVSPLMPERERARLEYDTAREWERKLKTEGMAEIYEQARYSSHEVNGIDVKRMREACRKG